MQAAFFPSSVLNIIIHMMLIFMSCEEWVPLKFAQTFFLLRIMPIKENVSSTLNGPSLAASVFFDWFLYYINLPLALHFSLSVSFPPQIHNVLARH